MQDEPMIRISLTSEPTTTIPNAPPSIPPPDQIWQDLRSLLHELDWFVTRDWQHIAQDPLIQKALIQRATRAALLAEDIRTDVAHGSTCQLNDYHTATPGTEIQHYLLPVTDGLTTTDPPHVVEIPVSVDRVILYDFGTPKEHEHPLYTHHYIVNFCAAFYHEEDFIFARAHLQLLLTPANILNWLAGPRSGPVDQNHLPLLYLPDGNLFRLLGLGITQLIYQNQTELMMKMKQGRRFAPDFKISGLVIPGSLDGHGPAPHPKTADRQQPAWINPNEH
jgi:hypothetical protein